MIVHHKERHLLIRWLHPHSPTHDLVSIWAILKFCCAQIRKLHMESWHINECPLKKTGGTLCNLGSVANFKNLIFMRLFSNHVASV